MIATFGQTHVEYRLAASKRLGFILRDYDTVWKDILPNGEPVTITKKSRGARNEILNGAVPGSSYGRTPGLPATEKFDGGSSVFLTRELCHAISRANWEVARKYISWTLFKAEILRATRKAGFWANTISSDDYRFEFHNGDSNEIDAFGILVQPMSMSGSVVSIIDANSKEYIIEAIGQDLHLDSPFASIHEYQYLWAVTSNSVRLPITDRKGNKTWQEWYFEPLLSGNIRIPMFGTFETSLSETGWAAKVPKFRIEEVPTFPYPWIMRDDSRPPSPFAD